MRVHRYAEVFADLPDRVVAGVVERLDVIDVGRDRGDEHAAAQAVLFDPLDISDGVIDLVQEDLPDAGPAFGVPPAPVGEPAVVGADTGEPVLVLLGRRRPREQDEAREEWRHRVREDDLADDAVVLEIAVATLVVPVADSPAVLEITERVAVLAPPRVEVLDVPCLEILPVHVVAAAGMAIRRDDRVMVVGRQHLGRSICGPPRARTRVRRTRHRHGIGPSHPPRRRERKVSRSQSRLSTGQRVRSSRAGCPDS